MTTQLEQAARQALEALEQHGKPWLHHETPYRNAITALRAALEQPAQDKPVAFCKVEDVYDNDSLLAQLGVKRGDILYARPQAREPLTDEEIRLLLATTATLSEFARAIEAAHGIGEKQ